MSEMKKVDFYLDKIRALHGKEFRIDKVNKPYRKGFDESAKRFRSFYAWPKDDRQVIESGDAKSMENAASASFENCREKIWNKDKKKMEFHRYDYRAVEKAINDSRIGPDGKLKKEFVDVPKYSFFKAYRKAFDIRVTLKDTSTFTKWDKTQVDAKVLMCEAVSASLVRNAIETLTDINIPLVDGKDKLGKPAKVKPFDWEDSHAKALEGLFAKLKVSGEGMDTKYLILPTAQFTVPEEDFGKDFGEPSANENKFIPTEALPFE